MKTVIQSKELSKIGYKTDISRSLAINILSKHCKHQSKEELKKLLEDIIKQPELWRNNEIWSKLALHLSPENNGVISTAYDLYTDADAAPGKVYGSKYVDTTAKQQMNIALKLPVALQGALMPDAHAGYGLPIGGVLAANNAVIPYAVGVDIGCRMALTILNEDEKYVQRYAHQIKKAIEQHTHFGMDGGLAEPQYHEVLDSPLFKETELLRNLQSKAARQLGSSGSGNHFVEFGVIELFDNNELNIPAGKYTALLSHSGSRGLGAAIAMHYTQIAQQVCQLPREAKNLAWLDLDSEIGQEYWFSMTLAGDYAKACHDRIHYNLSKALGLKPMVKVENHHNFAWKEQLEDGTNAIVHRKGATPAHKGQLGIIPGSMTTAGYLVSGMGAASAINSASHGAGRLMSRSKAKDSFTNSSLKKLLVEAGVSLIGGSTEESPLAYKDIESVMQMQEELVKIQGRFMPRIVRMNKD
ncbi:RNA-splicing ligase RtcB [compost metagenome]